MSIDDYLKPLSGKKGTKNRLLSASKASGRKSKYHGSKFMERYRKQVRLDANKAESEKNKNQKQFDNNN